MSVINLYFLLRRKNKMTQEQIQQLAALLVLAKKSMTVKDNNGILQIPQHVSVGHDGRLEGVSYHDIRGTRDSFQAGSSSTTGVNYQRVYICPRY